MNDHDWTSEIPGWPTHLKEAAAAPSSVEITPSLLKSAVTGIRHPEKWAAPLTEAMREFGVSEPREIAALLAHLGHESSGFNRLEENLNYSASRLRAVWPSRFSTTAEAKRYAGDPPALAEKVYGGRLGNTAVGDGWKYRGRGLIMLTGRSNYRRCERAIKAGIVDNPDRLKWPEVACRAALWYWTERVDHPTDIVKSTKEVNGGYHGLEDRKRRFRVALAAIGGAR